MNNPPSKPATTISGARALVDGLLREDIDHVFGIPGTQNLAILDELRATPQIRFILTRHEQGAAFMAYGFARAAGKPSVVTVTGVAEPKKLVFILPLMASRLSRRLSEGSRRSRMRPRRRLSGSAA